MTHTETRGLDEIRRHAKRLLKDYVRTPAEARTPILRQLAEDLVEAREHFLREDGTPDWKGRTYTYRLYVREIYDALPRDEATSVQAAVRYHVGAVLRERVSEETLGEYGLSTESPREKSAERRQTRSAVINALSSRDLNGGALLALSAAYTILSRLDAEEVSDLDERGREVAEATLADMERRVKALRRRLK